MPNPRTLLTCAATATVAVLATLFFLAPARATQEQVSLMEILAEWKYPGSTMLSGARMNDGGNPEIEDQTCRAILTTHDPVEEVFKFYSEKTGEVLAKAAHAQAHAHAHARAVVTQDDSKARPVAVRIIEIHRAEASNTLVISRGEHEKETHIAWSQYRRLSNAK